MTKKPAPLLILVASMFVGLIALGCSGDSEGNPTSIPATSTALPDVAAPQTPGSTAVQSTSTPRPTPAAAPVSDQRVGSKAPEIDGIAAWINSEPFTFEQLRGEGKVVLVDFWTYTCVNCIRTFPYLREWHAKYADSGLVIVGVHAPEFDFEMVLENVEDAVMEFDIGWPVALDNDFTTWRAFQNQFWPAKYLIAADGVIVYTHFGEGGYAEAEDIIRATLEETGADLSRISAETMPEPEVDTKAFVADPDLSLTRELYAGYDRNYGTLVVGSAPPYVLHREYYEQQDAAIEYTDPGQHNNHFIYLQGLWRNGPENLVHARETENYEDYVAIRFYANSVNLVMEPGEGGESYDVRLLLNGEPVPSNQAGKDVQFDGEGNSFVTVDEPKMYRLINLEDFSGHELRLSSNSDAMAIFAFTFGAYKNSPENLE